MCTTQTPNISNNNNIDNNKSMINVLVHVIIISIMVRFLLLLHHL